MNLTKISEQTNDILSRIISNNNFLGCLIAGLNAQSDPRSPSDKMSSDDEQSSGIIVDLNLTADMLEGASIYQQKLLAILEHVLYAYNPESKVAENSTKSLIKG